MRKRSLGRECALKILYSIEISKSAIDECIESFWADTDGDFQEDIKKFTNYLVKGIYENLHSIDNIISKYADNWDIKRIAIIDKNILRMGIFELLYSEDVPFKVSINESIELAKRYGDTDSGKFVNGILDRVKREKGEKT